MLWNSTAKGEIFVIDEDVATREALTAALGDAGYRTVCFADGAALLSQLRAHAPVCVLLEVRLPDRDGLDILRKLRAENCAAPVFITSANANIAMAVEAVRSGAYDVIEKPFSGSAIVARIEAAIAEFSQPYNALPDVRLQLPGCEPFTRREREVLARIAIGETNKEAARKLGLSARTIEGYRAKIMKKVGARNAAELLRRVLSQPFTV
jgi:FixJ family two-component response regulator